MNDKRFKEFPARKNDRVRGTIVTICVCGHGRWNHTLRWVKIKGIEDYIHTNCETCVCNKFKPAAKMDLYDYSDMTNPRNKLIHDNKEMARKITQKIESEYVPIAFRFFIIYTELDRIIHTTRNPFLRWLFKEIAYRKNSKIEQEFEKLPEYVQRRAKGRFDL